MPKKRILKWIVITIVLLPCLFYLGLKSQYYIFRDDPSSLGAWKHEIVSENYTTTVGHYRYYVHDNFCPYLNGVITDGLCSSAGCLKYCVDKNDLNKLSTPYNSRWSL